MQSVKSAGKHTDAKSLIASWLVDKTTWNDHVFCFILSNALAVYNSVGCFQKKTVLLTLSGFCRVCDKFSRSPCIKARQLSDVNTLFSRKNCKHFFWGWYVGYFCFQVLVKGGASSQSMAADEFIVGAAEVLLEQVWPVFVLYHETSNSSLLSMQSGSLVMGSNRPRSTYQIF